MSAKVEALVAKHSKLRGSAKSILIAIARLVPRERVDGGGVYASVEKIAQQSGYSKETVRRAFKKARDKDELHVYYNRGPHGTNHYQVRVDVLSRRDSNLKSSLVSKPPPADCNPRRLRDKGSVINRDQYSRRDQTDQNGVVGPIEDAQPETAPSLKDPRTEADKNGYLTCPDCGRYRGRCNCDASLQRSFDDAISETLDSGMPGRARLASEKALRDLLARSLPRTKQEIEAEWEEYGNRFKSGRTDNARTILEDAHERTG